MKSRTLLVAFVGTLLAIGATAGVLAVTSDSTAAVVDPPDTFGFVELSVDGQTLALFSDLQGITSGLAPTELELTSKGGELQLKLPGKRTPPSVTLQRGLTSGMELSAWHELAMLDNAAARKSVTVTLSSTTGTPIARYHLANAWPSKLEISALRAGSSSVAIETVTIVAEQIQRVAA